MKKKIVTALALWLCLVVTVTTHVWAAEIITQEVPSDGTVYSDYNPDTRTLRLYGQGKLDQITGSDWPGWGEVPEDFGHLPTDLIIIESGIQFPDDCTYFFAAYEGQLDIAKDIDTSNVTNMTSMFELSDIVNLDISNWDTSNVTSMYGMFAYSKSTNPDVSRWDTSKVTTMLGMFYDTHAANPDVSHWDVSNVTEMGVMFMEADSANPDVSNWDTSSVVETIQMFKNTRVANPDVSNWDVSKVYTMDEMFENALAANPDVSKWDTSNVESMAHMFGGRDNLYFYGGGTVGEPVDTHNWTGHIANPDVSKWDVSKVKDMTGMFLQAPAANPDISHWNLASIERMDDMFYGAKKVKKLDFRNGGIQAVTALGELSNTKSLEEVWLSKMTAGSTDVALKGPFTIDYYDADGTIYKTEESNDQRFTISEDDAATASQIHLYLTNPIPDEPDVPEEPTSSGSWLVAPLPEPAKDKDTEVHTAYLTGYPDGTVMAEGDVTRGEAAAMVLRLAGKSLTHDDAVYHDVDANAWYSDYVLTAKALSMLDDKDGKLRPNDAITRGEFAAMLAVLDKDSTDKATFSDIDGHKYEAAIEKIAGNKRIIGYDDGTFRPDATLTRGEAVTILNRMFDRVADGVAVEDHSELKAFTDLNVTDWYYYEIVEAANTHRLERRGGIDAFGRQLENWTDVIDTAK
ncbi:BspA family leucine-rich repeat surface protein [Peptoniphilus equinus]|uniref:BspA family leucine-rich repeat surface protein n=1 Tax=Peptoniphilus equinus TaxID=3016343 RepID=A0ABY7QUA3_9FIRM|nr:BspA family leucine-rich repeat surface protein [Peptoniphilus equinus]WBW50357.1 BspA family leucine-rich repeat surface protein [Peptoniphilus equinus]